MRLWDEVRYAILEDIANCIVRMFSEKYIRAIYFIDLSGGEVAREGFGIDIDLIIEVENLGLDKYELESTIETIMHRLLSSLRELKSLTTAPRIVEVHIIRFGKRDFYSQCNYKADTHLQYYFENVKQCSLITAILPKPRCSGI